MWIPDGSTRYVPKVKSDMTWWRSVEWKTHVHNPDLIEGPHGMSWEAVGKASVGSIKAK